MTREEAIADIKNNIKPVVGGKSLDMAIEALQTDTIEFDFNKYHSSVRNKVCDKHDLVKVVRCKDCRHYESDGGALMVCSITDTVKDDADYCSYGERREKNDYIPQD